MNRIQWLIENRLPQLVKSIKIRENIIVPEQMLFEIFVKADPNINQSNVQWLMQSYIQEGFLYKDIVGGQNSKAYNTLNLFYKFYKKLPVCKRSIYQYKTLSDLYTSVHPYVLKSKDQSDSVKKNSSTGEEIKRQEKLKIYQQTFFITKDVNFKMVVPLTQESAQWWGQGTQWCTSAYKNNQFYSYNQQAPLLIVLFKDHQGQSRRLQLFVTEKNFQFMDEKDVSVTTEFVKNNWSKLCDILTYSVSINAECIKYIPFDKITFKVCSFGCKKNGAALRFVPDYLKSIELCMQAVKQTGLALFYVPEKFKTEELCALACQQTGLALEYVPDGLKTQELCWIAIEQSGKALPFVPDRFKDINLYKQAVQTNIKILNTISIKFITQELCILACQNDGNALQFVPEIFKIFSLCKQACEQNGRALKFVPEIFKTIELCEVSIKQTGLALEFVPKQFKTEKLCKDAVQQTGKALTFVPYNFVNFNFCWIACERTGTALWYVPFKLRTPEICMLAVRQDGWALEYLSDKEKTVELCLLAIEQNLSVLQSVPEEIKKQTDFQLKLRKILQKNQDYKLWNVEQVCQDFTRVKKL